MPGNSFENTYSRRQQIFSLSIIFVCCVIAYWPVTAGIFSLKNDAVRYFLPVRYQISEMINQGQFPFWTAYINLGHPLYTDMQSGVWNPFVWLISLFGSYTMRSLQTELFMYVFLSGVSMFYLLKYLKINYAINIALAVSYMLCGFISDSAQFAYWICGMAFLPFVFLFFLKLLREPNFHNALLLSFFLYLLFVTGYPGIFIIIFYFLLAYFIVFLLQVKKERWKIFKFLLLGILFFCLFSLPVIIAYFSGLQYITRGTSLSLEFALSNSLHPFTLISYFLPLVVWKLPIIETDILGRNSFLGLLPVFLVAISFFIKNKNLLLQFLKWTFILTIFLSLGKTGILRTVFYYVFPLMDTFRHPSLFRFLTIFSGILIAAITLNNLITVKENNFPGKKIFVVFVSLIVFSSVTILILNKPGLLFRLPQSFNVQEFKSWLEQSTVYEWLLLELLIQVPFLVILYKYFVKKINLKIILTATVINSIIHTMILQPVTVVSSETVSSFEKKLNDFKVTGFPLSDLNASILSNSNYEKNNLPEYIPVNMFNKKPGYQFAFVTPGPLINHEKFMETKYLHNLIFDFPLLYRADTAILFKENLSFPQGKKFVIVNDTALLNEINSVAENSNYKSRMLYYAPGKWEFEVVDSFPGFFCLSQNYYPKWELTVNGQKENIYLCNLSLTGFKLQPGINHIKLAFVDEAVLNTFYLQLFLWILFIIYIIGFLTKRNNF